jgi:hypothetical protein
MLLRTTEDHPMVRLALRSFPIPIVLGFALSAQAAPESLTRQEVEHAIREGVCYLKEQQREDGSWPDLDAGTRTGTTSLVTLALLSAGEPADSPTINRAIHFLRDFAPGQLRSVYAVSLQTRAFAAADPDHDKERIARNVRWLEQAQIQPRGRVLWPGSWAYDRSGTRHGDNSNTHYALLGLDAAAEVGVPVKPLVWALADRYWSRYQQKDGGWGYTPDVAGPATASMTCAGISSLILARTRRIFGQESLEADGVRGCGRGDR